MNSSDQPPRIPLWVFFLTDLALLAAAAFIAAYSVRPLTTGPTLAIVACVITGAVVALVPLVLHYERQKNETLDDRQRALEALAATVSGSAEQIAIATAGLQQISEAVQKNLRHAEQLPQRLHEKISEFQAQLANVNDAEKEELEKEVATLRETETERLQSISDRLTRAAADFAKLEATTHQHLSAANEAVGKLALGTANAIGKAQAAAEQALSHARTEAARHLGESAGQNLKAFETAKAAALADLEARLTAAATAISERMARELSGKLAGTIAALDEKLARLDVAARSASPDAPSPAATAEAHSGSTPAPASPPASESATGGSAVASEGNGHPPGRRGRKPRREEATAVAPESSHAAILVEEPPPVPVNQIVEVAPVAPDTAQPFVSANTGQPAESGNGSSAPAAHPPRTERRPKRDAGDEVRKRAVAAHERVDENPDPAAGEDGPVPAGVVERVLTSDGATRLIVTAYIGIGNRLFIRGQGPGLSWDKGVPLQFVSIGKWRWETNDAADRIEFKLLKNDEQECAALGAQALDPGHQHEVTATF